MPKLEVGRCDDPAEKEADRIADKVVAALHSGARVLEHPEPQAAGVHRAFEQDGTAEVGAAGGTVSPEMHSAITSARAGGTPLRDDIRQQMEHALGADLSAVRVHTGPRADALNTSISARAFTVGSDVFFRGSVPSTASPSGTHLLAHELAHVVQQRGGVRRAPTANISTYADKGMPSAMLKDFTAVHSLLINRARCAEHLQILETDLKVQPPVEGGSIPTDDPSNRLDAVLAKYEKIAGFSPKRPEILTFARADDFERLIDQGEVFRDLGAQSGHGEYAHRIQWFIIASEITTGFTAEMGDGWSHTPLQLYKASVHPDYRTATNDGLNNRKNLWDDIVDQAQNNPDDGYTRPDSLTEALAEGVKNPELKGSGLDTLMGVSAAIRTERQGKGPRGYDNSATLDERRNQLVDGGASTTGATLVLNEAFDYDKPASESNPRYISDPDLPSIFYPGNRKKNEKKNDNCSIQ